MPSRGVLSVLDGYRVSFFQHVVSTVCLRIWYIRAQRRRGCVKRSIPAFDGFTRCAAALLLHVCKYIIQISHHKNFILICITSQHLNLIGTESNLVKPCPIGHMSKELARASGRHAACCGAHIMGASHHMTRTSVTCLQPC